MEVREFLKLLRKRKQTIFSILVICLTAMVILVVLQPLKYGASSRILVSQEFSAGTDAYTISQSNSYLSQLLAEVVESEAFYEKVTKSGYNVNSEYFTQNASKKEIMEKWNKTVQVNAPNTGNGVIKIEVFHPNRGQAEQVAQAINYILKTQNQEYHGLGDKIFLKIIDSPTVSERPVKPDILTIFPLSVLLALFIAGVYIYFSEKEYEQNYKDPSDVNRPQRSSEPEVAPSFDLKQADRETKDKEEEVKEEVVQGVSRSEAEAETDSASAISPKQVEFDSFDSDESSYSSENKDSAHPPAQDERDIEEKGDIRNVLG